MYYVKKIVSIAIVACVIACVLCSTFVVQAETYSRDYPSIGNSGSPVWLECEIQGYGRYCIVLPPNTNLYQFGFDAPTGYNLINNSGSTVSGKAYSVNSSSTAYLCQWSAYDQLYFRVYSSSQYYNWQAVTITKIYGTTLMLVDEVGERQNDYVLLSETDRILIVLLTFIFVIGIGKIGKRMWYA